MVESSLSDESSSDSSGVVFVGEVVVVLIKVNSSIGSRTIGALVGAFFTVPDEFFFPDSFEALVFFFFVVPASVSLVGSVGDFRFFVVALG